MIQAHSERPYKGYRFSVEVPLEDGTLVEMGCQTVSFNVEAKQARMVRILKEGAPTRWPSVKMGQGAFSVMLKTSEGDMKSIRYNYHNVEYVPIWQGLDASADDFVEEALIFYGVTPQ